MWCRGWTKATAVAVHPASCLIAEIIKSVAGHLRWPHFCWCPGLCEPPQFTESSPRAEEKINQVLHIESRSICLTLHPRVVMPEKRPARSQRSGFACKVKGIWGSFTGGRPFLFLLSCDFSPVSAVCAGQTEACAAGRRKGRSTCCAELFAIGCFSALAEDLSTDTTAATPIREAPSVLW